MAINEKEYLQINQALFSITNAYSKRLEEQEAQYPTGLLMSDRSVLMVLGQVGAINSRSLSEIMGINPGTISVYVQRMVEKGLIEKEQDQADRRNWVLNLTDAGKQHYQQTIRGAVIYTRDFLEVLSEEEQASLHEMLIKISHHLGYNWQ